jgi:hypothetical protein
MHPEITRALAAGRRDELVRSAALARRSRRRLRRWHVSWTRTVLAAGHPGRAGAGGSSLVIIISAHRPA